MKKLHWLLALASALLLGGCAGSRPVDPGDENLSLVFGYFDMKDAPSSLEWVSLRKYDSKQKDGEWYTLAAKDGLFFHVGIEPGSYQVDKFGGTGGIPLLTRRPFEYSYGAKGRNATAIRIQKPGVYFLGSHRYVNHAGQGLFEPDKFDMQPAPAPSEKELLQKLVQRLESDKDLSAYTRQLQLARQRLSKL
jgi:hypothetical protein